MNAKARKELLSEVISFLNPIAERLKYETGYRWEMSTKYGYIDVTFYPPENHTDAPWIACYLKEWDAPQGVFNWYGWKHWKQNVDGVPSKISVEQFMDHIKQHFRKFFQDQGQGFPDLLKTDIADYLENYKVYNSATLFDAARTLINRDHGLIVDDAVRVTRDRKKMDHRRSNRKFLRYLIENPPTKEDIQDLEKASDLMLSCWERAKVMDIIDNLKEGK